MMIVRYLTVMLQAFCATLVLLWLLDAILEMLLFRGGL